MNRFAQDCTGDGKVDCWDYAAIHKLGGYGCKGPLNEQYKAKFISCQQQAQALAGGVGQIDARSGLPAN
ncbi:hypothetical protein O3M35_007453 [Rhynocoris fuscipes]|uniref:lysozyme n=1 Tax=Rhynocoris fuscipes TaxID=488301 RepID=A0AAW1DAB2_9HEMI